MRVSASVICAVVAFSSLSASAIAAQECRWVHAKGEAAPENVTAEEARLTMRCGRECYVTIFNLAANDRFSILFPNSYESVVALRSREEFAFPRPGLALVMRPFPTHQRDAEAFFVVATKQPLNADTRLGRREDLPIGDVLRMLSDLPLSERAELLLVYEVRAK